MRVRKLAFGVTSGSCPLSSPLELDDDTDRIAREEAERRRLISGAPSSVPFRRGDARGEGRGEMNLVEEAVERYTSARLHSIDTGKGTDSSDEAVHQILLDYSSLFGLSCFSDLLRLVAVSHITRCQRLPVHDAILGVIIP